MVMNKKTFFIAFLTVSWLITLRAQQNVLAAGGDNSSGSGSVAFSIGQVGYTNYMGESGSVALGVQQPNFFNIVATEEPGQPRTIRLYPNPATETVYVDLQQEAVPNQGHDMQIRLFDLTGKLISQKLITEMITPFSLTGLHDATYILQVRQDQKTLTSFKLFKSN